LSELLNVSDVNGARDCTVLHCMLLLIQRLSRLVYVCRKERVNGVKWSSFSSRRGLTTAFPIIRHHYCSLCVESSSWLLRMQDDSSFTAGTRLIVLHEPQGT